MDGTRLQSLDSDGALAAGHSTAAITMAQEIVAFQNALVTALTDAKNNPDSFDPSTLDLKPDPDRYPHFASIWSKATQYHNRPPQSAPLPGNQSSVWAIGPDEHPCGTMENPIPSDSLPVELEAFSEFHPTTPRNYLREDGYQLTAFYATVPVLNPSANQWLWNTDFTEYTKEVDHYGPDSESSDDDCLGARFRYEAVILWHQDKIYYQRGEGEPNPQVLEYGWPYWSWGGYVLWWHLNY